MPRLPPSEFSQLWLDVLTSITNDLEPLGRVLALEGDRRFRIETRAPSNVNEARAFWRHAHHLSYSPYLASAAKEIAEFERDHIDVFADLERFVLDAVSPSIEIVDFRNSRHQAIYRYLQLYQSVTSRKLVGKQMGLLIWDDGQVRGRPLIGAAFLSSPRYSQRIRDSYIGWERAFPRTSKNFSQANRDISEFGLDRLMQLSIACSLPPYRELKGAWLAALVPFTKYGRRAFETASKKSDDPDLAAVVTTTAFDVTGVPFQKHRLAQLGLIGAGNKDAKGNLYCRIETPETEAPLRASFKSLISQQTLDLASKVFKHEEPERAKQAKSLSSSAMSYVLRRLRLSSAIFDGNEMGVHVGMLSESTKKHLKQGTARLRQDRLAVNWDHAVQAWKRCFVATDIETACPATISERNNAREARRQRTLSIEPKDCLLSNRIALTEN